jgi:hypothetical protein
MQTAPASADPAAWRRDSFPDAQKFTVRLSESDRIELASSIAAIERHERLSGVASCTRSDFPFGESLERKLDGAFRTVRDGCGFVLLKGLPVGRGGLEAFTAAAWGVGLRFGQALSQNAAGQRITEVIDATAQDDTPRMYRSNLELRPHSDITAMIALACWRPSAAGGATVLTSALTVHDEIAGRAPELLAALYRGFHYHRLGEEGPGEAPVTPWRVPVFARREGRLSCRYQRAGIAAGHRTLGQPLSETELAALDLFDSLARSPSNRLSFSLERGDMLVVNNYALLHARSSFSDEGAAGHRCLVRLWLDAPGFRDVPDELRLFGANGVPAQEGRRCTYDFRKLYAEDPRSSGGVPSLGADDAALR